MYWNRFDICEAWYLYASSYHKGQNSYLYKKLSQLVRVGFRPTKVGRLELTDNGSEIYQSLADRKVGQ